MICASACCSRSEILVNQIKVQLPKIYNRAKPRGDCCLFDALFLPSAPKKCKISQSTFHRWERAAENRTFSFFFPFYYAKLVRALSLKAISEMFATQSLTKQFNSTATTTSSLTRKQQKAQSRRRAGNQIARASSANVEKPKILHHQLLRQTSSSAILRPRRKRRSQNCQRSRRSIFRGYLHRALPNQFRYVSSLSFLFGFREWRSSWISKGFPFLQNGCTNLSSSSFSFFFLD